MEAELKAEQSLPIEELKERAEEVDKQIQHALKINEGFTILNSAILAQSEGEQIKFVEAVKTVLESPDYKGRFNLDYACGLYKLNKGIDSSFTNEKVFALIVEDLAKLVNSRMMKHSYLSLQSFAAEIKTLLNISNGDEHGAKARMMMA